VVYSGLAASVGICYIYFGITICNFELFSYTINYDLAITVNTLIVIYSYLEKKDVHCLIQHAMHVYYI